MRLIRWVLVVTFGEAVGISVPAAVGVAVTGASWGPFGNPGRQGAGGICGRSNAWRCPG